MSDSDQPLFLGRYAGYEHFPTVDPVECVDEAELERQTSEARRRERARLLAAWAPARRQILDSLDAFKTTAATGRVRPSLRMIERGVDNVDRRLSR